MKSLTTASTLASHVWYIMHTYSENGSVLWGWEGGEGEGEWGLVGWWWWWWWWWWCLVGLCFGSGCG